MQILAYLSIGKTQSRFHGITSQQDNSYVCNQLFNKISYSEKLFLVYIQKVYSYDFKVFNYGNKHKIEFNKIMFNKTADER